MTDEGGTRRAFLNRRQAAYPALTYALSIGKDRSNHLTRPTDELVK
jgi:hypothetical protein